MKRQEPPRRTKPRYPWQDIAVGEQFVVRVPLRQNAMEQCSRAGTLYNRRFVVIAEFPPHGWLVQRVPNIKGAFNRLKKAERLAMLGIGKPRSRRDPLQHLYEVLDAPEPWET